MSQQRNEFSFKGQSVYLGIDVHLKSWNVTILTEHNKHKTFNMEPVPECLSKYLDENFPGATRHSAYEAGFSGVWAHRRLEALGFQNLVVNPGDIPTTDKEYKEKRDASDSNKIARALRGKALTGIYIHSEANLKDRSLLLYRADIVKRLNTLKHQIKADLYLFGIRYPDVFKDEHSHWTRRFITWLEDEITQREELNGEVLGMRINLYRSLRTELSAATRALRKLSESEAYADKMRLLRSVPGIGLLTGMYLAIYIEDIERFPNNDHFVGFLGIKPTCHSSGEKESKGEITSGCQSKLRSMLVESSWTAARIDPALSLAYNKLRTRMAPNKAVIRIARKLANRIYHVLKTGKEYEPGVLE